MTSRSRALLTVAVAAVPIALFSACGSTTDSGEGSSATLLYTPATNYGLKQPATTTTTTTIAALAGTPAGGTSPSEQTYTVQAGDSLFAIAERFGVTPDLICSYNGWPDCIDPPHLLLPGDDILIPPGSAVPGAAGADTASEGDSETDTIDSDSDGAAADESVGCEHTVVAGDNPTRLANQYDVELSELEAANRNNPSYNTFLIGSKINIPASGNC